MCVFARTDCKTIGSCFCVLIKDQSVNHSFIQSISLSLPLHPPLSLVLEHILLLIVYNSFTFAVCLISELGSRCAVSCFMSSFAILKRIVLHDILFFVVCHCLFSFLTTGHSPCVSIIVDFFQKHDRQGYVAVLDRNSSIVVFLDIIKNIIQH